MILTAITWVDTKLMKSKSLPPSCGMQRICLQPSQERQGSLSLEHSAQGSNNANGMSMGEAMYARRYRLDELRIHRIFWIYQLKVTPLGPLIHVSEVNFLSFIQTSGAHWVH